MPGNLTKPERQDTVPVRLQARTGGPRLGVQQRLIPVSARFFAEVSAYLKAERPAGPGTDIVFVVLKGPRRGMPLSAEGWMRSSTAPPGGPGSPGRPAISCGILA